MSRFGGTAALVAMFCLVTLAYNSVPTLAQELTTPLLDTDGNPVTDEARYYILQQPSRTIKKVGLTFISRNGSCPLYVGQDPTGSLIGIPARITLAYVNDLPTIYESTDVVVSFGDSTTCSSITVWALDQDSKSSSGRRLITTASQNRGGDPFLIVKEGNHYKLRYCPTYGCGDEPCRCGDAGIVVENGRRLLAIGVNPALPVVFMRA